MRGELRGVDEDRDDDAGGALLRDLDQGKMPGMERAHGRHQRDRFALHTEFGDGPLELRQGLDDAQVTLRFGESFLRTVVHAGVLFLLWRA